MVLLCGFCGLINQSGRVDVANFPEWAQSEVDEQTLRFIAEINKHRDPVHGGTYVASDCVLIPRRNSAFHGVMLRVISEEAKKRVRFWKFKKMCEMCVIGMVQRGEVEQIAARDGDIVPPPAALFVDHRINYHQ